MASRNPLGSWLAPAGLALLSTAAAAAPQVVLELYYDDLLSPSDPEYEEVLAFLHYPPGAGPLSLGYPAAPRPALLTARGGNSNSLVSGSPQMSDIGPGALEVGLVDVFFNYAIVAPDEDYRVAADGIALLVQYLRANAAELNLRPDRIALQGRSFGTIASYAVALCEDRADPTHPDPVRHQSSRIDLYAPRFGPSNLSCFAGAVGPWASGLNAFFFPGKTFAESSPEERRAESATAWLVDPRAFDRAFTPPLFVVYDKNHGDACGGIDDVHSGLFGELMLESIDDFAEATGSWDWHARCGSFPNAGAQNPSGAILGWVVERLAEDGDGLWLTPPAGAPGASATLGVFGAEPGAAISFFVGTQPASFPIPGCPGLLGHSDDFVELGTVPAASNGLAQLQFAVGPGVVGQTLRYHAVDLAGCEASNLVIHVW